MRVRARVPSVSVRSTNRVSSSRSQAHTSTPKSSSKPSTLSFRASSTATKSAVPASAPKLLRSSGKSTSNGVYHSLRFLNLHEYQSKALLDKYGVNTQRWRVASTPEEAEKAAKEVSSFADEFVVKAQIHAGGRGVGTFNTGFKGGVHLCKTTEDVKKLAKNMLGNNLVTKQTAKEGVTVKKVMIAESLEIKRESYLAILMDRAAQGPVIVVSPKGGVDIEQVAHDTPDQIFQEPIDINVGVKDEQAAKLSEQLGFPKEFKDEVKKQIKGLYELFMKTDASQVEINPFAEVKPTSAGQRIFAIDAKINFDENASYRQKAVFDQRDTAEEDPREVEASKHGLNYIGLDGTIGCMVNGAGLAMATMDIIKLYKGDPANFLDVGGGANEGQISAAFQILVADPRVKAILINIFGGIMKCDVIAQGIVNAAKSVGLKIPVVVRLAGTNVEKGKQILKDSGLAMISASDLDDAAEKAVAAAGITSGKKPDTK